ncbi:MAG TPA: hypothetical protein PLL36_11155 [Candidatus Hydrogenedentes bacterium]|jgi:hypothetical protein|nr:MAG: hypothetical protein BWX80_04168 [Candidatus Hydrogenedentes bacterium ADurb.Bin101]HOC70073.1 hypothetical protein [Candidatus Hydrogenedentota bacterium]HQN01629.1 hypothetical protein [Candidatus Hydrogenedentota bacterium]
MKKEYIDCIALKRRIQREIAAETKGMTPLERLVYYRKLSEESSFAALMQKQRRGNRRSVQAT